jgi:hypothetical protein
MSEHSGSPESVREVVGMRLLVAAFVVGCAGIELAGQEPAPDTPRPVDAALMRAAQDGDAQAFDEALAAGADAAATDASGSTALTYAAARGNAALVDELLEVGADADVADILGLTPLMHAAGAGHTGVVERLAAAAPASIRRLSSRQRKSAASARLSTASHR